MRRGIAIGLLILQLGLFTELHEVIRLPILVAHFIEHREQVPSMSFYQFMAMHYKTDVAHDATDMELPFKDCDNSVTSNFALLEQKDFVFTASQQTVPVFFLTYISFVPSSGLDEIFQPPRA